MVLKDLLGLGRVAGALNRSSHQRIKLREHHVSENEYVDLFQDQLPSSPDPLPLYPKLEAAQLPHAIVLGICCSQQQGIQP